VIVLDPHSRSIAFLWSLPTRSEGVTGTQLTLRSPSPSADLSTTAICRQRSIE